MAWQNSSEQPFNNQSTPSFSAFAGQNAQQFSAAFNNLQAEYPGMIAPQQPQIPQGVIAAAQAAGLGTPTREYRKGVSGSSPAMPNIQSLLSLTFLGVGVIMLVVLVVILLTVPAPFNLISAGITVITILPFVPMILRLRKSAGNGGGGKKTFVAWSCSEGLVYTLNNQINAVRWSDIQRIWRKVGMLNGMLTTLGYVVEPRNAQLFSFSMLNGPFADMILGNTAGSMSVSFGGGEISNNGGFVQISGYYALTEYAGLGDLIEEQSVQQALPPMMETFHANGMLTFGSFVVRQQGMSDGMRELSWEDVDAIQLSTTAIQITKKPTGMVYFNLSAATLPNFAHLCALLNTIRGEKKS